MTDTNVLVSDTYIKVTETIVAVQGTNVAVKEIKVCNSNLHVSGCSQFIALWDLPTVGVTMYVSKLSEARIISQLLFRNKPKSGKRPQPPRVLFGREELLQLVRVDSAFFSTHVGFSEITKSPDFQVLISAPEFLEFRTKGAGSLLIFSKRVTEPKS